MHFQESYFAAEERNGFFIEEKMKHAWAAQIEVLSAIDQLCRKHRIPYFADSGTLLGTIRHQGFIPWDDDIDISMKREDYTKFIHIAMAELPAPYEVLNEDTAEDYAESFIRIINGRTVNYSPAHLAAFHGCPYAVGIDIFPLDYLPANDTELMIQKEVCTAVWTTCSLVKNNFPQAKKALDQIEELCGIRLDRSKPILHQLIKLFHQLSQLYHSNESEDLALMCEFITSGKYRMKKEWYEETIYLPFETIKIPVPKNYKDCLIAMYGEDYMIPQQIISHDYPFYKKQEAFWKSLQHS